MSTACYQCCVLLLTTCHTITYTRTLYELAATRYWRSGGHSVPTLCDHQVETLMVLWVVRCLPLKPNDDRRKGHCRVFAKETLVESSNMPPSPPSVLHAFFLSVYGAGRPACWRSMQGASGDFVCGEAQGTHRSQTRVRRARTCQHGGHALDRRLLVLQPSEGHETSRSPVCIWRSFRGKWGAIHPWYVLSMTSSEGNMLVLIAALDASQEYVYHGILRKAMWPFRASLAQLIVI